MVHEGASRIQNYIVYCQQRTIARKLVTPAELKHFHAIFIIIERNTTHGLLSVPDTAIQE